MSLRLLIRPIIPRSLDKRAYELAMKGLLREQTEINKQKFKTVSDKFTSENVTYRKWFSKFSGSVFTKSPRMAYLNYGTKERWAIMSKDWKSMTSPNTLATSMRRGKVLRRGRSNMTTSKPGIEARRFDRTIVREEQKPFEQRAARAMKNAARNTF